MIVTVQKKVLEQAILDLERLEQYYTDKVNDFMSSRFSNGKSIGVKFTNYLKQIRAIYTDIASNIKNTKEYLKNYLDDILALESEMSNTASSYISVPSVSSIVLRYRNMLEKTPLLGSQLFLNVDMVSFSESKLFQNTQVDLSKHHITSKEAEELVLGADLRNDFSDSDIAFLKDYFSNMYQSTIQQDTMNLSLKEAEYKKVQETQEKLSQLGYTFLSLETALQNATSKAEKEKLQKIMDSTGFSSSKSFQEYAKKVELEFQTLSSKLHMEEQTLKTLSYSLGMKASDYQNFKESSNIKKEDLASLIDRDNHIIDYKEYCKKYGEVDPYTFKKTINENFSNVAITGMKDSKTLKYLEEIESVDPEIARYYRYLYQKFGEDEAHQYLKDMEETIHMRTGELQAKKFLESLTDLNDEETRIAAVKNHLSVTGKGLSSGVVGFGENLMYALEGLTIPVIEAEFDIGDYHFSNKDFIKEHENRVYSPNEYETMYILQAFLKDEDKLQTGLLTQDATGKLISTSDLIDYTADYGKLLDHNYQISSSIGNMLPSVVASALVPGGQVLFGVSAAGGSYHSAMVEGESHGKSLLYGTVSGASELLTEKLLGGIPFLSDVQATNFKTLLQASGKEGVEEFVQSYLDAGTQKLIFNKNSNMGELFGEAVQSAAYGAITGGIMNVPQFAINRFNINTIDKQLQSGKISKGEFLEAMHNLIPETENMSYEEIKKEYLKPGKETTLTLTKNEGKMFSKNGFSSLMSGIGMFGTGAFSLASKSQSKNNSDVSTQESHSSVSANQNASINPTSNVISKGDTSSVKIHAENDIELKAGVNQESFERVNLDEVNKLSSFKNVQTVTEALDVISESVDLQKSLDTISKKVLPKAILGMINFPSELLAKFKYDKLNSEISQKVANEGIYHITSLESVNKILESGYVKASNVISSYGAKKSFFFAGLPNVGDVACNFPEFLQKCVAVKLNVPESDLSDFRYRSLGDHAVTHKGDYHFDSSNGSLAYLGMFEENGKLVYKEISKSEYENFHSNIGKGKINSLKTNLQSLMLGFATEYENSLRNLEQIKNTFANTNMNETLANLSHKAKSLLNEKVDIKNVIDVNSQMYQNAVAINKYLKKGINGITRVGKCSAGVGLLLPFAIHPFLGLATLGKASSLFNDGFYGNVIKNSFLINAEGRKIDTKDGTKKVSFLYQNPMAFGDFIKSRFTNGKTEFFTARSINALQYLEANKSYGTVSQPFTLYLLKKAQKLGFIENLTYQKSKVESNLILERLLLGVEKRDKKIQMFDIAFDTTGKKLTQSDIETLTKGVNLSEYKTKTDKKGRIIFDLDLSFQDYLKNSPEVLKKFVFDLYDVMKAIPKNTGTKIKEKFANSSLLNQVYGNMDVSCAALNASVSSLFQRIYDSALNIRESLKSKFSSLDSATYQMVEDSLADIPYSQNKRFFLENISSILRCDLKNASKMFQDAKQYLISMIPDLCIRQKGNMDFYEDCMSFFDTDFTRRVNEMSYDSVYQKFSKYLTKKEKSLLKDMVLNEPYMGELEQQAISFYTKVIGPVLTSYLRGVDTNFSNGKAIQTYHGGDINWVRDSFQKCFQRWIDTSNAKTKEFVQNNVLAFDYQDPDFMVEMMDSVIESSEPLKQDIVVYRTVDGIYKDGDKITTYDIGTRFTDKAYQSTSLTKGLFANNPTRILLKIEVPERTKGAYLEKYTGITQYGQQEFLLDRNATMEITGDFYYDENQMLVLPVRVLSTEMSKMGIDKALPNSSLDYFQVANISEEGQISLSDVVSSLKEKGLISVFEEEVRFLKKHQVYDSSIPEHGLDHVKNVLLSSLYMGQEMHLSRREQLILTKAASLHDCGIKNNHKNHGLESANLIDRYVPEFSSQDKNLLKAVIEYHEMPDNGPNLYNIHHKYALTSKEDMQSFQKISNILKDADAIDRVRFPNNLNSSLLRLDLSKNLLKAEYQLQEIRAKNILNQNLKSYHFETRQAIEYLQSQNIPSYLIYMYVENPWYTGTYRYFTPEIKEKLESIRILGSQDILSKVESYKNLVLSNHAIYDWLENHDLDDALDLSISQEKLQEAIRLKRNITESFQYMNEKYQFLLKENPNLYNWLENSNLDSTLDLFIDKKLLEEGRLLKEEIQKVQEQLDFQYRFSIDEMITEVRNYQKIIQENPNLENWLKNHDLDDTVDFTIDPDVLEKAYALKKNIDEQFKLREIEYQTTLDLSQKQSLKSELDTLRKEMGFMNTLDIKKVLGNIKDLPVEAQNYIHELSIDSDYLALKGFVDTLIHGYQTGDEDVKTIVENIDALKLTGNSLSFNDNLKFGTSKFMDENSLPDGSFLKDAHMYIDNEVGNGFQVMSHEMGHMLWDTLNNKSLPDNYSHVMDKIREKWRQDPSKLESFLTEAREYKEKLWSQMKSDADSYFELHKEDVANQIEEIFQDENQLYDEMTKASKMYGISLDEMNQMIDSKDRNRMVDLLKRYLKTNYIHDNFYYICDNDSSMQIYDTVAGIIDSIYNGENPYFATIYDNGFLRSHTSDYFSSYDTRSFDEQFADFTRMKFYDMQAVKLIVNELCGPEWFDMMNDKFHEIAVQMKEKDSWYTASGSNNTNADINIRVFDVKDVVQEFGNVNDPSMQREFILNSVIDKLSSTEKRAFVDELVSSSKINALSNMVLATMMSDTDMIHSLIGTEALDQLMVANLTRIPDVIAPMLASLDSSEFHSLFQSERMQKLFQDMPYQTFLSVFNCLKQNSNVVFDETILNKILSFHDAEFHSFAKDSFFGVSVSNNLENALDTSLYEQFLKDMVKKYSHPDENLDLKSFECFLPDSWDKLGFDFYAFVDQHLDVLNQQNKDRQNKDSILPHISSKVISLANEAILIEDVNGHYDYVLKNVLQGDLSQSEQLGFFEYLLQNGKIDQLSGGVIFTSLENPLLRHYLSGTERLCKTIERNIFTFSLIHDYLGLLSKDEFHQTFNHASMKKVIEEYSDSDFDLFLQTMAKNKYTFSNETILNKICSLSSESFLNVLQNYGYFLASSSVFSMSEGAKNAYDAILQKAAHLCNSSDVSSQIKIITRLKNIVPDLFQKNKSRTGSQSFLQAIHYTESLIMDKVVHSANTSIYGKSILEYGASVNQKGWYKVELEVDGVSKVMSIFTESDSLSFTLAKEDLQAIITNRGCIKSITYDDFKNQLFFYKPSGLYLAEIEVDGQMIKKVVESKYDNLDLSSIVKPGSKVENINLTAIPNRNQKPANSDVIYQLVGEVGGQSVSYYLHQNFKGELDVNQVIKDNNLYQLEQAKIVAISPQEIDRSNINIFQFQNGEEVYNSHKYGGNQEFVDELFLSDHLSEANAKKVQDIQDVVRKYFPEASEKEVVQLADAYQHVGCNYMSITNTLITYFHSIPQGDELFKKIFGYDLYYVQNGEKLFNFEALALDLFLDTRRKDTISDTIKMSSGISASEMVSILDQFLNERGIIYEFIPNNHCIKSFSSGMAELLDKASPQTFYFLDANQFDLKYLDGRKPGGEDGAIKDSILHDNIFENIGSHAMLITDIDENGNFIVSSWGGKYQYLNESFEKYANNTFQISSIRYSLK